MGTYRYGMKGAPAVGRGLGGLPGRATDAESGFSKKKQYKRLFNQASTGTSVTIQDYDPTAIYEFSVYNYGGGSDNLSAAGLVLPSQIINCWMESSSSSSAIVARISTNATESAGILNITSGQALANTILTVIHKTDLRLVELEEQTILGNSLSVGVSTQIADFDYIQVWSDATASGSLRVGGSSGLVPVQDAPEAICKFMVQSTTSSIKATRLISITGRGEITAAELLSAQTGVHSPLRIAKFKV